MRGGDCALEEARRESAQGRVAGPDAEPALGLQNQAEPAGGAQNDYDEAARLLADGIEAELSEIEDEPGGALRRERRAKFRAMGVFT